MMSGDGIVSAEFASIAGPGADGTLMTFAPDPRKNPNAKDVVAKFKAKNFEPEAYTLYCLRGGPDPGRGGEAGRRRSTARRSPTR